MSEITAAVINEVKREILDNHHCETGGYPAWMALEDFADALLERLGTTVSDND